MYKLQMMVAKMCMCAHTCIEYAFLPFVHILCESRENNKQDAKNKKSAEKQNWSVFLRLYVRLYR